MTKNENNLRVDGTNSPSHKILFLTLSLQCDSSLVHLNDTLTVVFPI